MSLKTRFGNLGNILDFENLTKENIYVLDSPILTNSHLKIFKTMFSKKIRIIDCTFNIKDSLRTRLEQIREEAEIAVRGGTNHLILSDINLSEERTIVPMILAVGAVHSNLVKLSLRGYASINVQTAEAMDTHSFAVLIGVGAGTVSYRHLTLPTILIV